MSWRSQNALPLFELVFVTVLLLIAWGAFRSYEIVPEPDESRSRLRQLCGDYVQTADYVRTSINGLADSLNGFLGATNKLQRQRFQSEFDTKSEKWRQWVREHKKVWNDAHTSGSNPITANGVQPSTNQAFTIQHRLLTLVEVVDIACTNYLWKAQFLMSNASRPLNQEVRVLYEQAVERDRSHLLGLAQEARIAARDMEVVLSEFALSRSQARFWWLETGVRGVISISLFAFVAVCFGLMLAIYWREVGQARAVIGEQQRQHGELHAAIDKLANFGQLAQELAHEIKQPLIAISARLYTLQKRLASDSEAHKDVAVIGSEIAHLGQIVKDFRQQAQPNEPRLADLTAKEALGQVRDLMTLRLEQKGIDFKFEVEDLLMLHTDPLQLKQVLINLLNNAAESLLSSGTVTLRARKGTRALRGVSTEVAIIEVEDSGAGIPPEIRAKIFDPFFSTKKDGTGLGLTIAARMVDKHQGLLEFDTQPGKGTTFRIVLPARRANQHNEQSPAYR